MLRCLQTQDVIEENMYARSVDHTAIIWLVLLLPILGPVRGGRLVLGGYLWNGYVAL